MAIATYLSPTLNMSQPALDVELNPRQGRLLHVLLIALVVTLVFEGLARRLVKGGLLGTAMFFGKDLIVVLMIPLLSRCKLPPYAGRIVQTLWLIGTLIIPLAILTAIHDPVLALFGAKQYLLFPIVSLVTMAVYGARPKHILLRDVARLSMLIVPTALMAFYQLRLPPDHWLNLSPEGLSLEEFSAGGRLRVSSTFPFVAQFCMFLNAAIYFCAIAVLTRWKRITLIGLAQRWTLPAFLLLASFATGSRGAVVGGFIIFIAAGAFIALKGHVALLIRFTCLGLALFLAIVLFSSRFPEYFEAYTARKRGTAFESHDAELADRIEGSFTRWFRPDAVFATLFGHGIGTMSNGAERFSNYAREVKRTYGWGEVDLANTYLEGGLYLIVTWIGFRVVVLYYIFDRFIACRIDALTIPLAFLMGYIVVTGVTGTLGIQPPLAIWWWLGIGIFFVLSQQEGEVTSLVMPTSAEIVPQYRGRSRYAQQLRRNADTGANRA